jgi:hypothetical protein
MNILTVNLGVGGSNPSERASQLVEIKQKSSLGASDPVTWPWP